MVLVAGGAGGTRRIDPGTVEGGAAVWYFALSQVELGELCLAGEVGGNTEWAEKVDVTARDTVPDTTGGIYKVVQNHQWTCGEQPQCGNYVSISVLDAAGQGVSGATVKIGQPATTVPPIYNDTDPSSIPATVTMDSSGSFVGQNYWPKNENGLQVFQLSVDGHASDVATEITTGWWEDDLQGCNYCGTYCVNVWGHWSYSVVFQLDPDATDVCEVENDHQGMASCGAARHIHHDPDHQACYTP